MKTSKSKSRIFINTGLFLLASAIFAALGLCGAKKLERFDKLFVALQDSPSLCFESDEAKKEEPAKNAYVCKGEVDENGNIPASESQTDQSIFLYDRLHLATATTINAVQTAIVATGIFFSIASLFGAIIYWNHNRS